MNEFEKMYMVSFDEMLFFIAFRAEFEVEAQNSELHLRILHCRLTVREEQGTV